MSTSDMSSLSSGRPNRSIPEQVQQMWERRQLSINSLVVFLQALDGQFRSQHSKRVYIIIDAIDESNVPRDSDQAWN